MSAVPDLMHATQVPRPFHTKAWVYEETYDGWRMLALKAAGHVRFISWNGEVAVFDQQLVSRFEWLRHINHGDLATPPLFMVFDLLQRRTIGPSP